MAQGSDEGGAKRRCLLLLNGRVIIRRSAMKCERGHNENESQHGGKEQLVPVGVINVQPAGKADQNDGVANELQQPGVGMAEAGDERFAQGLPVGHGFTSMVAASVVEMMDGWYMGCTDAGLMRKLPGFTIFSR